MSDRLPLASIVSHLRQHVRPKCFSGVKPINSYCFGSAILYYRIIVHAPSNQMKSVLGDFQQHKTGNALVRGQRMTCDYAAPRPFGFRPYVRHSNANAYETAYSCPSRKTVNACSHIPEE